jgi:hypothetical protein
VINVREGRIFEKERGRYRLTREGEPGFRSEYIQSRYPHQFVGRNGRVQGAEFSGRGLAIMQDYKADVKPALQRRANVAAAQAIKIYDNLDIRDATGNRVHPSTNIDQIAAALNRMSRAERVEFDNPYPKEMSALAA